MTRDLSLDAYNAKRDFTKTSEPAGVAAASGGATFIVQKHDATRLHYDFRLELDGVLKSWAVTRGPSLNPDDKRLAVRTEDHPLSYASFEGVIPKREYGGGTIMLWDRGTWTPHPGKEPIKTLAEGHLHFTLQGTRMRGEWIMIRLKPRAGERRENWLLRKVADEHVGASDALVERELTSIATGRTMAEIAAGVELAAPSASKKGFKKAGAKLLPPPAFRSPQLATLADHVPAGSGYLHEIKYDGYRVLLAVGGGDARAFTRTEQDWTERFRDVVGVAAKLAGSALIDGEVVALDADGRPSFQALQNALKQGGGKLAFFAFDLLEQDGESLLDLPNIERKGRLAALLAGAEPPIHYAEHVVGNGEAMFAALCGGGYEGVVSKLASAPYRTGRRSAAWLKVKCVRRQEFVIVGCLPSEKNRGFKSLLLGLNEGGELRYAGKAGTGFDTAAIGTLLVKMAPLERAEPTVKAPPVAVRGARWIEPRLVAEIAFTEFTDEGVLRHPSFIGMREDKPAGEVVREREAHVEPRSSASGAATTGVKITHPERVIYPEDAITKGQLADYYAAIAGPMLEWSTRRPISLVRCPQGRAKHCFFQKHDAGSFGDLVHQVAIPETKGAENYLYVDDVAGLVACVQMGTIEFHGWGSKVDALETPDRLVFDLDPDEGLGFDAVKAAAVKLRGLLADMGLVTFPLLTGGKGLHVVAPLDRTAEWDAVKDFASRFSRALAEVEPQFFTANIRKAERKGRIFLDWLRNQRGSTAIMPYSARARAGATVSAPIFWDELERYNGGYFSIVDVDLLLARAEMKELQGWGEAKQSLPSY